MVKVFISVIILLACSGTLMASENLVSIKSPYSVKETADRFEKILKRKGLTTFARINHSKNASGVGLELVHTEVIVFGNPKVGTPLMQCAKTVAIDLPQKALFWTDAKGDNWLSYNHPEYLKERHNIVGCDHVIEKINGVLGALSKAATSK